jgi:uncharacterized membrane protein
VREVVNDLAIHDEPGRVASLQGGATRTRGDAMQQRWPPATRLLAGVAGTGLALRGVRGDGALDSLAGLLGFGLLIRAVTDLDARRLTGMRAGRRVVDVEKMITIDAPIDEVFAFWSDFENFPRFMSHLREVRDLGGDRSHWVATGPGGVTLSWDAVVTERRDGELIRWRSIDGSPVENAGTVRFQDEGGGRTRVDVHLSYNPPAGALGHAVASLLGSNARQMMNDDLLRLKSLLEDGKTTAHHRSVQRGDLEESAGAAPGR